MAKTATKPRWDVCTSQDQTVSGPRVLRLLPCKQVVITAFSFNWFKIENLTLFHTLYASDFSYSSLLGNCAAFKHLLPRFLDSFHHGSSRKTGVTESDWSGWSSWSTSLRTLVSIWLWNQLSSIIYHKYVADLSIVVDLLGANLSKLADPEVELEPHSVFDWCHWWELLTVRKTGHLFMLNLLS